MPNFFIIKYKINFPNNIFFEKILSRFKKKFRWIKKNKINYSILEKSKIFYLGSSKRKIKENFDKIYILNGDPIFNKKKLSINFFIKNIKNIYEFDNKIYGGWSLVVINKKNTEISVFQNRLSHKPTYYFNNKNIFILSSDLRSILNSNIIKIKQNNKFKLLYTLCNYKSVYGRGISPINKIFQIKFNQVLFLKKKFFSKNINEQKKFILPKKKDVNKKYILDKIQKILINSCKVYEKSNNCIALSGGIDSAMLAYNLKKIFKRKLNSISIIFEDKNELNEIDNIKILEKKFIHKSHKLVFKPSIIEDELENSYNYFDNPIPTVSFFGFYKIFTLASKLGYKNIFTGYGADAAVCGYYEHYLYNLLDLKRNKIQFFNEKENWIKKHSTKEFKKNNNYFKNFLNNLNSNFIDDRILYLSKNLNKKIFINKKESSNFFFSNNKLDNFSINSLNTISIAPSRDTDQTIDMLNNTNIISPFSNLEFLNLFITLGNNQKIRKAENKYILKRIYGEIISKKIFDSKKIGFNMPLNKWINDDLKEFFRDNLTSKECLNIIDLKKNQIENIFQENEKATNHTMLLWQLINYFFWAKKNL